MWRTVSSSEPSPECWTHSLTVRIQSLFSMRYIWFLSRFTGGKNDRKKRLAIVFLGCTFASVIIGFYLLGHPNPQVQTYTLTAMGSAFSILCAISLFDVVRQIIRVLIWHRAQPRTVEQIGYCKEDFFGFMFIMRVFAKSFGILIVHRLLVRLWCICACDVM